MFVLTGAEHVVSVEAALHGLSPRAASPHGSAGMGLEELDSQPQDFCAAVASIGDQFAYKLRLDQKLSARDFMFLPLDGPPGAHVNQVSSVDACEAMLKQIASQNLRMESEAQEPFDYRLVPFPLAVALYVLDAVGALPPKMTWSMVMMLVPFLCHIELAVTPNKNRKRQKARPRLPGYPCGAPGAKKSPVRDTFMNDILEKRIRKNSPQVLPHFPAGMNFSGGSTAKGITQLLENGGVMTIVSEEAGGFFPRNFASSGQVNQSEHFKPELLLPMRTGAPPERNLLKDTQAVEHTQVGMCFFSQFPAARQFIVEVVKKCSNGWAQGFVFTFSRDRAHQWEEQGDDEPVLDFLAEVLEIVCRAYGAQSGFRAYGDITLADEAVDAYKQVYDMVQRCKTSTDLFSDDLLMNFSKWPQWAASYSFAVHAVRESIAYGHARMTHAAIKNHEATAKGKPDGTVVPRLISSSYTRGKWGRISAQAVHHLVHFLALLQRGVQVLVSEASIRRLPAHALKQSNIDTMPPLKLGCFLLNQCTSRDIDLQCVRLHGVSAKSVSKQRFQAAMQACETEGLGATKQSPGGRSNGQPKMMFTRAEYTADLKLILDRLQLNHFNFVSPDSH